MVRRVVSVLQAGRGLAALAVVVFHAAASTEEFTRGTPGIIQGAASYGYLGVDFFFVLSGFIIYHTRTTDWRYYAKSRFARIFAPYLPMGIGLAAAYTLLPHLTAGNRHWDWLATVTLIPGSGEPALIVAWTLQFELAFYAVFGAGVLVRRPVAVVAIWCLIMALLTPVRVSGLTIEFLFGVLSALAIERSRLRHPWPWFIATLGMFIALGATASVRTVFGMAMSFMVIGLVRAELAGKIRAPAVLVFLGAASYSIYLVHNPVAAVTARFFANWYIALLVCLTTGTFSGIIYHLIIEAPALRFLKPSPAAGLEGQA